MKSVRGVGRFLGGEVVRATATRGRLCLALMTALPNVCELDIFLAKKMNQGAGAAA